MSKDEQEFEGHMEELKTRLKEQTEKLDTVLLVLQGRLGEKGLVHIVADINGKVEHIDAKVTGVEKQVKEGLDHAASERKTISGEVDKLKTDKIKLVTIISTLSVAGTEGLKKLVTIFGGGH